MLLFVNYRRDDSVHAVMMIADRLARHFGRDAVYRDHDSIPLGTIYPDHIRKALRSSDAVLAVIGPRWLDFPKKGGSGRRIDDDDDWVRTELRTAFRRRIPVVPVLLDGGELPERDELPDDIALLSSSKYWHVRHRNMDYDITALIARLDAMFPGNALPDEARPETGQGTNYQHNVATDNGTIYASQNGTQIIGADVRKGRRS